ncbi:Tctex-1 family protein [Tritrichomonas foetus]|uniref:Tctex-1 family protein n=1 Tax=Tritrichomonas foetus TaxID=1144522 RepID=A0A1J4JN27_9EUKA|nr:Tctex-1 family protein [Tritrichomonas foetus]|eukprot:OHS98947.1 Tctex-1 family protein [Tritrichomonas foetus]
MNEEIQRTLGKYKYNPATKEEVIEQLTQTIINRFSTTFDNKFKFLTHCIFLTNGNQDFDTFSNNLWNSESDGFSIVDYNNDDFRFVMTVWGLFC